MTSPKTPVLEFPAMLHGTEGAIRRRVRATGERWSREYLETGAFSPPKPTRPVLPGEVLVLDAGAELFTAPQSWRLYMFGSAITELSHGLHQQGQAQASHRTKEALETFCLSTVWGALYWIVSPSARCSASTLATRFAAALRCWEELQGLRYAFFLFRRPSCTLEEVLEFLYRKPLEAWSPGGPTSLREHMALAVERMSHATRDECEQALLRLIPFLVAVDKNFKHPEVLRDPEFLRERFSALPLEKFEYISGGELYSLTSQLAVWDRELGRH